MELINAARANATIEWRPTTKCFHARQSKLKMRGVHQIVDSFMPHTRKEHKDRVDVPVHGDTGIERAVNKPCRGTMTQDLKDSRMCKAGTNAKEHGSIVDEEIGRYARTKLGDRHKFLEEHPDLDRCTVTLINYFEKEGITPLETQVIVGDIKRNCATMIDLVCRDLNGSTIVVELKATKHTSPEWYETPVGMLKAPLHNIPCSMLNVDMLQLLTTVMIVKHGNAQINVGKALLMRVSGNGLWVYSPPDWFSDATVQHALYGDIQASARKATRERQLKQKEKNDLKEVRAKRRAERIKNSKKPWKVRIRKGDTVHYNPLITDML